MLNAGEDTDSVKKFILVAGARPNFMKIAPILRAMEARKEMTATLVHTGQHYDANMSDSFFSSLGIRPPDYNLEAGSASHAVQTANIMVRFEEVCKKERPDCVVVVGDVNSTIATGLVAKKMHVALAHVEAGLRSGDRDMPEEINRIATDAITDIFFTTEKQGTENLLSEGHDPSSVHFVGHVMIDNLFFQLRKLDTAPVSPIVRKLRESIAGKYVCMTMHRPSNVDSREVLNQLLDAIQSVSREAPVIFPCHPRTRKQIENYRLQGCFREFDGESRIDSGIILMDPLGYDDFLYLWKDAALVLTDSGGMQEETTALRVPCITMRENTERPITKEIGTNEVAGTDAETIRNLAGAALEGKWKESRVPELWDGCASERIVEAMEDPCLAL